MAKAKASITPTKAFKIRRKKRTSIGGSHLSRPNDKARKRRRKQYRGQGHP